MDLAADVDAGGEHLGDLAWVEGREHECADVVKQAGGEGDVREHPQLRAPQVDEDAGREGRGDTVLPEDARGWRAIEGGREP